MSECYCNQCSDQPLSGYMEEYRHECEARKVARWTKDKRTTFYVGIRNKRGVEAANKLIHSVNAILEKQRKIGTDE